MGGGSRSAETLLPTRLDKLDIIGALKWNNTDMSQTSFNFTPALNSFRCYHSTTDWTLYRNPDQFGEVNGTMTRCGLSLCAKTYKDVVVKNSRMTAKAVTDHTLVLREGWNGTGYVENGFEFGDIDFVAKDTREEFTFAARYYMLFLDHLNRTSREDLWQTYMAVATNKSYYNYTDYFDRVATTLTSVLQTPDNPSAINITGDAYGPEIFIDIRWRWFILPLATILLTLVVLLCTIYQNRHKGYLFKTSTLAVLMQGSRDWNVADQQQTRSTLNRAETRHDLMKVSKRMEGVLKRNEDGVWELRRVWR